MFPGDCCVVDTLGLDEEGGGVDAVSQDVSFDVYVGQPVSFLLVRECLSAFDSEADVFSADDVLVLEDCHELLAGEFVLPAAEAFAATLVVGGVVCPAVVCL